MLKSTKILSTLLMCSLILCAGLLYRVVSLKKPSVETEYPQNETSDINLTQYRELYAKPVSEWAKPNIDESVLLEWKEFAPLSEPNFPKDNAYSDIKAFLGLRLFNEPKLSKSGQIAC